MGFCANPDDNILSPTMNFQYPQPSINIVMNENAHRGSAKKGPE
jgi:hypothetical protein